MIARKTVVGGQTPCKLRENRVNVADDNATQGETNLSRLSYEVPHLFNIDQRACGHIGRFIQSLQVELGGICDAIYSLKASATAFGIFFLAISFKNG